MNEFERLDVDVIEAALEGGLVGRKVVVYDSTASSNDIAWEYAGGDDNNGLCVFAEAQTAGRGRMGNTWLSDKGKSLLCSILLLGCQCQAELLTLVSAVAAAEAIGDCAGKAAKIKWPNDVIIRGKKIAGILLESRSGKNGNDYVIGIGINCHQDEEFFTKNELQQPASSVDIQCGAVIDRNRLAGKLLASFDKWLVIAQTNQDEVARQWQNLSSLLGHRVTLNCDRRKFTGNCIGVDPARGLILQLEKGGVRMFDAAHTTIIKQI